MLYPSSRYDLEKCVSRLHYVTSVILQASDLDTGDFGVQGIRYSLIGDGMTLCVDMAYNLVILVVILTIHAAFIHF